MRRIGLGVLALGLGCFLKQSCDELECGELDCTTVNGVAECTTCGDGRFDAGVEQCDGSDINEAGGGSLCDSSSALPIAEGCGDGVLQPGSFCYSALVDINGDGVLDIVELAQDPDDNTTQEALQLRFGGLD